jgi:hypothetical protein
MSVKSPYRRRIFRINALFGRQAFDVVPVLFFGIERVLEK